MVGFRYLLKTYPQREQTLQKILEPQLARIKEESTGQDRHKRIMGLYERYGYHPIFALRSAIPVFIQLPFLFAAFYVLNNFSDLAGESFYILKDLSKPDNLKMEMNILPFVMTFVNILSTYLTPGFNKKARGQAIGIAVFFLLLLYNSASALLFYWTMNNVFFLGGTIIKRIKVRKQIGSSIVKLTFSEFVSKKLREFAESNVMELAGIFTCLMILFLGLRFVGLFEIRTKMLFVFTTLLWMIEFSDVSLKRYLLKTNNSKFYFIGILFPLTAVIALFSIKNSLLISHSAMIMVSYTIVTIFISALLKYQYRKGGNYNFRSFAYGVFVTFIIAMIPAISQISTNIGLLTVPYLLLFVVFIFILALITYFLVYILTSSKVKDFSRTLIASAFLVVFIFFPTLCEFTVKHAVVISHLKEFLVFFLILFGITFKVQSEAMFRNIRNISLIVLIIFVGMFTFKTIKYNINFKEPEVVVPEILHEISFKETPDIFLLVYDGMPNDRNFRALGLTECADTLNSLLQKYGFKSYKDTYTLGSESLGSMGGLLNLSKSGNYEDPLTMEAGRVAYLGQSVANSVLRNNGYKTFTATKQYLTGVYDDSVFEDLDGIFPEAENSMNLDQVSFLQMTIAILRASWKDIDVLTVETKGCKKTIGEAKREFMSSDYHPKFVLSHVCYPSHTHNHGPLSKADTLKFVDRFYIAMDEMEKDFKTIEENAPDAIVIAMSDHGPSLMNAGYRTWLPDAKFDLTTVTEADAWDRFGTMLSIRWY